MLQRFHLRWSHLFLLLAIVLLPLGMSYAQETVEIYSEVEIQVETNEQMVIINGLDLDLDHFHLHDGHMDAIIQRSKLPLLDAAGIEYELIHDDYAAFVASRNRQQLLDIENGNGPQHQRTTQGFTLGSMGGFYTYDEIVQKMDEMIAAYPNIISSKVNIGTSIQGRTIWAIKISDNPNSDESSTEAAAYFDALHHAREPASMAVVMNYMYYLLENYGTDPGITYLVDNREMFFVPIVNPDGYVYNQSTNPGGGGMWRKNRRVNSGTSCRGVDLNRNYDWQWNNNSGSSGNPCSETYRGASPFSEPETQAVRDYTTSISPIAAYTLHTFGGYYLGPDFSDGQQEFAIHAEINNDCLDENEHIYGDAALLLGFASGTTQYWLYDALGSLTWTPEIGTDGFWAPVNTIIPLVNEHVKPMEYLCWVVGAIADYQGFTVLNGEGLSIGQNLELDIEIKNKGLSQTANNVVVTVSSPNANVTGVNSTINYGNIASRAESTNSTPFTFSLGAGANPGDLVKFYVDVFQDGTVQTDRDSFYLTVGDRNVLFNDNAEGGTSNWSNGGSGTTWAVSTEDAYTGNTCFVDSQLGHTASNNSRRFSLNSNVSLANTTNPRLEFAAKWGLYSTTDYVRLQISTNNGSSWSTISTSATENLSGSAAFVGNERWTHQSVDLSAYVGQSVRFRFVSFSNSSLRSDGFYFDDFRVVDYQDLPTCNDGIQNGSETGVDCGGPDCAACPTCDDGIQNGNETGV
ncbi:MAG: M14 family zinc carboxypeptidase, partial [Bacteroidota bacterium]